MWARIRRDILADKYIAVFCSPPCRTFSEARTLAPGPPQLRDKEHPYGFTRSQASARGLSQAHYETIREDNLLAERTAEACELIKSRGGFFGVEQPWPWKDSVSMFDMEPFTRLVAAGALLVVFDQCMYGAVSTKPTQILFWDAHFEKLECRCDHPWIDQRDSRGKTYQAPHPPVVCRKEQGLQYATKALVAYPYRLNVHLANIILDGCKRDRAGQGLHSKGSALDRGDRPSRVTDGRAVDKIQRCGVTDGSALGRGTTPASVIDGGALDNCSPASTPAPERGERPSRVTDGRAVDKIALVGVTDGSALGRGTAPSSVTSGSPHAIRSPATQRTSQPSHGSILPF